jgi:hypothetical protein
MRTLALARGFAFLAAWIVLVPAAVQGATLETGGAGSQARPAPNEGLVLASTDSSHAGFPLRIPDPAFNPDAPDRAVAAFTAPARPFADPSLSNWTILVYMVADNDLEPFAMQDLNEMEAAPPSDSVSLVAQVDRSNYYDTSNDDWMGTRRYQITRDSDPSRINSNLVADLGELNMGDPQTLVDFLLWGVGTYPARHYLVVLWDHGYGWSGGLGNDLGDGDHLSLAEMGAALREATHFLNRPLDVVGFDACLMQQVDVLYELAWVADYVVAAEDLEPAAGWVYDAMLSPLMQDPTMAPADFARSAVTSYMDYYGTQGDAMMSATSALAFRTVLVNAMDRLALSLATEVEPPSTMAVGSAEQAMWEARDRAVGLFNADYSDLGEIARRLAEDGRLSDASRAAAASVQAAVNSTVLEELHSVYKSGLTGLSAYLPGTSVPPRYVQTRFANDSYWDEFLLAFLTGTPTGGTPPSLQVSLPQDGAIIGHTFEAAASASGAPGSTLRLQLKRGDDNWTQIAQAPSPLRFDGTLYAGPMVGSGALALRALDDRGRPSVRMEPAVEIQAPPVSVPASIEEFALAVNRTRVVEIVSAPRSDLHDFTLEWRGLPPGVNSGGSSTSLTSSGGAPFNITLSLTAATTAVEGPYDVEVRIYATGVPTLFAATPVRLVVTRPLADLAVGPIVLSQDLPLPSEVVTAWTNVSNLGFENATGARVVAAFTDGSGTTVELANFTTGPLSTGTAVPLELNFTATAGLQKLRVWGLTEPTQEELHIENNAQERVMDIVNLSMALYPPPLPVAGTLGSITPVPVRILNAGTEADGYNLTVADLSNASWQVALPFPDLVLGARASASFSIDVLPPLTAEGGDVLTFNVSAVSQKDPGVHATARIEVSVEEWFNATLHAQPNDVDLPAGAVVNVTINLHNTGNGHEAFTLLVQNADARLAVALNVSTFFLGPGSAASARLTMRDAGLLSTDRPYTLEAVAVSQGTGFRFNTIIAVRSLPSPGLSVSALEGLVNVSAGGSASFHVTVRNTGNTNVLVGATAAATEPTLEAAIASPGSLLSPAGSAVLNGSVQFSAPPLAGQYAVTVQAVDTRTGSSSSTQVNLEVAAIHDFSVTVSPAPTGGSGRTIERTLTLDNRGNIAEDFQFVVGYVEVGVEVHLVPEGPVLTVPARSVSTVVVMVSGPATSTAAGQIPIVVTAASGGAPQTVSVPYAFQGPPPDASIGWALVLAAAGVMLAGWVLATGPRPPKRPHHGP